MTLFAAFRTCLAESAAAPATSHVTMSLDVRGTLSTPAGGEARVASRPVGLEADFEFIEAPSTAAGPGGRARNYLVASATMTAGSRTIRRSLAADAREVLVAVEGTTPVPFLPRGIISRDEAELLDVPFDAAVLDCLLPPAALDEGDAWEIPGDAAAGLLGIDTISDGGLRCRLDRVVGDVGTAQLEGNLEAAVDGVPTAVSVTGSISFAGLTKDAWGGWGARGRVIAVDAVVTERRQPSFVAAGFQVEAAVSIRRSFAPLTTAAAPEPDRAATSPAAGRPGGPPRPGVVWHRHPQGRYELLLERRWRVVEDGEDGLILRLVDAGALVAQASIVPLNRVNPAQPTPPDRVAGDVAASLGGQFGHIAAVSAATRADGTQLVRVVAEGSAEGRPFRWIHHVVTDPVGHRVAMTCMLEPSLEGRFAEADRDLAAGLSLLGDRPATAPVRSAAVPKIPATP